MINIRNDLTRPPKRIVVKLGSASITSAEGGLDFTSLKKIIDNLIILKQNGIEIIVVSSGAINTGRKYLSAAATTNKNDISFLQAASAVGQPKLMAAYQQALLESGINCAQVLLTHDDLANRTRQFNTRNVILQLLKQNIIPILNENDSVSYDEITVGDNDQLAAMVAELVQADLLIILTGPDGLYDRDPAEMGAIHYPKKIARTRCPVDKKN